MTYLFQRTNTHVITIELDWKMSVNLIAIDLNRTLFLFFFFCTVLVILRQSKLQFYCHKRFYSIKFSRAFYVLHVVTMIHLARISAHTHMWEDLWIKNCYEWNRLDNFSFGLYKNKASCNHSSLGTLGAHRTIVTCWLLTCGTRPVMEWYSMINSIVSVIFSWR